MIRKKYGSFFKINFRVRDIGLIDISSVNSYPGEKGVCMCLFNNFTHDSRVLKEALSLDQAGYEIKVIALLDEKTERFEKIGNLSVERISANPLPVTIRNHLRKFLSQKDTSSSSKHGKGSLRKLKKIRLAGNCFEKLVSFFVNLRRFVVLFYFNYGIVRSTKRKRYALFHAHDLNTLPGAFIAAKRQNAKVIYDSHELYLDRNRLQKYGYLGKCIRKRVEAFLIRRSDGVLTVNDSLAEILEKRYDVKRPTVVMNVPSLQQAPALSRDVSLRYSLKIDDGYHILLYSGAITFNRGLENTIESLVHLPNCFLVLMGYGNDNFKNKLETIAMEIGVSSRFAFFGPVPSDQVTVYAASADLGVAPIENVCLSYYYCSPNKIFEYLIAGLPVIASDLPELNHIINQYHVGITFDSTSPRDIARAAREILESPEKLKSYKESVQLAAFVHNWENESKKLLDLYDALP